MQFRTRKKFGPKIRITERQERTILDRIEATGRNGCVENCSTGSVYVTVYAPDDVEIAKIRLSGHDEGRRQDSTHACVGTKSACMVALATFLDDILIGANVATN